jgi:hypothetical protein
MLRKQLFCAGILLSALAVFTSPAMANHIDSANGSATCSSFSLTVSGSELIDKYVTFVVDYTITLTPTSGSPTIISNTLLLSPDSNSNATTTVTGTFTPLTGNFTVSGSATLTEVDSEGNVEHTENQLDIFFSTSSLNCGSTPPGGKSFSIGPSSMEGDLTIHPGDWVSGGYNFKFTAGSHAATQYTVTAMVTVPVVCSGGSVENINIPLGIAGQLDGGGVTTVTYNIAAGDTKNHATGDQNSILAWEGAVQAPANLCGGAGGRNQRGAIFNATVTQNPHVDLVDWQFHYRDPAAKGKPNTDCTNASDPNRARADVCGASWSQTFRDP